MESEEKGLKLVETTTIEVVLDEDTALFLDQISEKTGLTVDRIVEHALLDKFIQEAMDEIRGVPEPDLKPDKVRIENTVPVIFTVVWKSEAVNNEADRPERIVRTVSLQHKDVEPFDVEVGEELFSFLVIGQEYKFVMDMETEGDLLVSPTETKVPSEPTEPDTKTNPEVTVAPESEWPWNLEPVEIERFEINPPDPNAEG